MASLVLTCLGGFLCSADVQQFQHFPLLLLIIFLRFLLFFNFLSFLFLGAPCDSIRGICKRQDAARRLPSVMESGSPCTLSPSHSRYPDIHDIQYMITIHSIYVPTVTMHCSTVRGGWRCHGGICSVNMQSVDNNKCSAANGRPTQSPLYRSINKVSSVS